MLLFLMVKHPSAIQGKLGEVGSRVPSHAASSGTSHPSAFQGKLGEAGSRKLLFPIVKHPSAKLGKAGSRMLLFPTVKHPSAIQGKLGEVGSRVPSHAASSGTSQVPTPAFRPHFTSPNAS